MMSRPSDYALPQPGGSAPGFEYIAKKSLARPDAAEVGGDLDELAAVRIEFAGGHVNLPSGHHRGFQQGIAAVLIRHLQPRKMGNREGGDSLVLMRKRLASLNAHLFRRRWAIWWPLPS